ncbi:uncharacterized protein LOC127075937 isoform X8 [Lathyrus oleraceus]|uniref:uncharacterized protein LOC127075937 isoform X7 n=1 Tax=Pisum sativum TaxID=3888 RepID=UPI0021D2EE4E|nr:uncharacterized protein LOC127075937 isoform X7 [Pisum sativum]XP_050873422.1 uncharacterized protein LOC127075937 isoform X8 [Pisum sativum]
MPVSLVIPRLAFLEVCQKRKFDQLQVELGCIFPSLRHRYLLLEASRMLPDDRLELISFTAFNQSLHQQRGLLQVLRVLQRMTLQFGASGGCGFGVCNLGLRIYHN